MSPEKPWYEHVQTVNMYRFAIQGRQRYHAKQVEKKPEANMVLCAHLPVNKSVTLLEEEWVSADWVDAKAHLLKKTACVRIDGADWLIVPNCEEVPTLRAGPRYVQWRLGPVNTRATQSLGYVMQGPCVLAAVEERATWSHLAMPWLAFSGFLATHGTYAEPTSKSVASAVRSFMEQSSGGKVGQMSADVVSCGPDHDIWIRLYFESDGDAVAAKLMLIG